MFDSARYDGRMPYRRCGDSGLMLPAISLGFWQNFGRNDDFQEARKITHRAFDRGLTHFDLANNYGPPAGSAEENVGRILLEDFSCHRDELVISTKAGYHMWQGPYGEWGSRKHLLSSLDQSLRRLRVDYVDIFYHHRADPHTRLEESMSALATAVNSGKALYAGLSNYPLKRLKKAIKILAQLGVRCLVYQPPYSIFRRGIEEEGILKFHHEEKIGCAIFSPLAQGLLTPKYLEGIPADSRAASDSPFLNPEQVMAEHDKILALGNLAAAHDMPLHHMALQWSLRCKAVTTSIIGARTVAQLDDSLDALALDPPPASLWEAVDAIAPVKG